MAFSPMVNHTEIRVAPQDVQPKLATYLKKSTKKPFLHPDAWLGSEGVRFGPRGGATGKHCYFICTGQATDSTLGLQADGPSTTYAESRLACEESL